MVWGFSLLTHVFLQMLHEEQLCLGLRMASVCNSISFIADADFEERIMKMSGFCFNFAL